MKGKLLGLAILLTFAAAPLAMARWGGDDWDDFGLGLGDNLQDEYGYYDRDYDWDADVGWYDDWYGDSDQYWATDDVYGYYGYDDGFDYDTDEAWYNDWYGESDELFGWF